MLTNSWNYGNILNQNGEILIGQAGSNPVASFLTSSGHTLSYTFGPGSINIEVNIGNSFFNPVQVSNGGTGRTVLTTFGVLIGEGSNNVNVTAAGTSGQVLIASTTGDPAFSTITSSGGTVAFTVGPNSLNLEISNTAFTFPNPVPSFDGGTGRTVLTTFGVLIGEGSNNVNVTAAGTDGQVLIASTTGDPAFSTITSSGGSVTFTVGPNSLNIEVNASVLSFVNPWNVPLGGTGRTVLTTFGVLIGEGSNNVNVTAAGTSGQVLIASTTGDPAFSTITSSGGTVTFTVGPNSLNVEVNASVLSFVNPWNVPLGGTGRTVLTTFGVLIGEGSNNVNVTAAGTSGQVLIASTTGDPAFSTITSSGGTVTFTVGPNSLNVEVNASVLSFVNPWNVPLGGTGRTVLTTFGVLIGEGSNNVNVTAAGTSGQVLIASTTGDPAFSTITSSGGTVTFTVGPNSLNVEVNASVLSFVNPWNVPLGGTGRTVLTTFGVLIGEGSNNVNVTAAGTSGQVLIASTTGDPAFSTITSSGGTVTFTVGPNSLNVEVNASVLSFVNPWNVPLGGTGRTVLTTFGVLIGEGSNNVNVTAAGTSGQVLIASTTGDPAFSTITSSGGTVTFTVGPNSLNVEVNASVLSFVNPWNVPLGGTGRTVLTTFGVLIGEGSNNVNVTAAGTSGQVLIASTTGDPAFSTITSSGGTVTFTVGPNSLNVEVNASVLSFVNPWNVPLGGTGRTVLTTFGVLIGEGSNNVNVTAAGTSGQVLIASTTGDPAFSTITSSGGTVTFTVGPNSLNVEVNASVLSFVNPWNVPLGGTGRTVLTTFGVLIGEGSNNVNVTAAGTSGQVLIASTTGDPAFSTITSSGGTVTFTVGPNSLNVEVNASVLSFVNPWNVPLGGTGRTVLTTFGVLIGEGSNNVNVTAAGTSGQVLIASTTGDPAFSTITSSGGTVTFTVGPNSLNIEVNASVLSFVNPWNVPLGGTGRTVLTTFGVLIGEGSNNVNVTAAGTDGQVLIASTTGDPKFSTITSSGGTVAFTVGPNSLNLEISNTAFTFPNPVPSFDGGTGRTVLTTFGVLIGEGSNNVNVTAAGTSGQVLIASTTGDPSFSTITSSGSTVTFTFGPNSLNIEVNASVLSFVNPWNVPLGGTGRTVLTTFGVLIGEGSNNVNVTAAGTDGQVLIASTTGDPAFSTITSSGGSVTFSVGPNSLNIEVIASVLSFVNPWDVPLGGTGRTVLTTFGVLIGEGSNNVNVTAAGTDGQVLIASTTGDPAFSTITSSGGSVTFTFGPNSLNIEVNASVLSFVNPWDVPLGGTGRTVLTTFGVLIGEGSNNVNVTAAGTDGQVLIASTTGDPAFSTITSSGGSVTFTFGPNSLNIEVNASVLSFVNPWDVPLGGTGRTVLTTFGVLIGEGSNNVNVTAAGTDGQVLIASTTGDPAFSTITSSGGSVTFTFGPNSLNIEVNASVLSFVNPWNVPLGGTGRTVLTTFGVLIGEGSNNVNVTAAGTSGQVLIASTTGDPAFSTITSSGGSVTFTFGPNSLNIEVNASVLSFVNPWDVPLGGTGRTVLTTFGVLIGEGSNNINVTAAGTDGQVLIASTTGDPAFSTITSSGGSVTFSVGPNSLNIEVIASVLSFVNPWNVPLGGTGRTVLTTFGVLIGEGSNNVNVTAAGTSGQVLIASTTGDPAFSTITSSGGSVTFTVGPNSLNIEVNASVLSFVNPWDVPLGGTGRTVLTTFGVLIGEGSNNVNVTAAGTSGQVLIASTTGDPAFSTITSSGGSVTFTVGPNSLNIEVNASVLSFVNPWDVPLGGTGRTVLTTFGVLIGEGSNNVNVTAAGTSGQVLIASTTGDPAFSTITSSGGSVTFTVGPNSLNIEVNASVLSFVNPWNVPLGGTGRTVLTTFGVLIGEGSNNINVTAAGTDGQVLIASTTGDPAFSTITSSGGSVTFSVGPNSLNIEVIASVLSFVNPWNVPLGGTGRTVLTTFGVLIGEGSNNVNVTAAGTSGQVLIASTTGDPAFSTITSSGGSVTFTVGPNSLNIEVNASVLSFVNPWDVPLGGTGRTVLTTFGVLIGEGSNNVNVTAAGTSGQVLIASTTGDPAFSTITSSGGSVTFTVGPNSLNIEVNASVLSFVNPWDVPLGGTGRTVLTTFGVLIGEGSNNVNVTAAGTSGQVLIASTTGDPAFSTITSSGGSVTFTVGPNSLNIEVNASVLSFVNPWNVPLGGTGRTVLTTFGVLIGEGSNNVNVTAAGTDGQVLIASTTGDPAFSTITSSGGSVTFSVGPNSLNIEVIASVLSFVNPWDVPLGGTGRTVLTTFGVLIGEGSNNVNVTAAGTDGQVLIASTTGDPAFSTITSSGGSVTFTFGPNSLNIEVNASVLSFVNPWDVPLGGTGRTVLTTFGVLIGEGSNNVNVTAAGTDGQVLIASTTGDPAFSTITSSGGTVTFTVGPNSLNVEVIASVLSFVNPWNVPLGGTGRTVLTTFGVLIGEGSNNVNVTAAGTSGQVLIASTTGDPAFSTITSSGGSVTFTVSPNSLNIEVNASVLSFVNPWNVPLGGTGRTVLTTFGVLIGEGSNNVNVTAAGTDGQVLIASTTGDPAFSTITSSGGSVTFSVGPNSLNIEVIASVLSFVNPWDVPLGGTGRTVLTTFGVLIGEGSNNVNVTAAGTDGQVLIASTTGDPAFSTITSSGGSVTFTVGPNSLNIEVNASVLSFVNPWNVPLGGTGRTVLTTFGVLIGEGSNNVNVTAAGTDGQVLIASTTGDPAFSTITSSGGTVTFTVGPNSLNIEVNASVLSFVNPWNVPLGGTGRTVLTTFGVLIGEGSNNVNVTAAGTSGQVLIASTTGDPKFSTITSSGSTVTFTVGPNSLNIEVNASVLSFVNPWNVPLGGTGRTVLTTFGVLIGEGSNNVNVTAAGTSGQVLIASTTGDPKFSTITSSGGTVTFTVGPNSLNIEVNASVLSFVNPWNVPLGGTGRTVLTTFGVLIGEGSNNVNVTAAGTSGQVLIASTTGDPKFSTITSSGGTVTFTVGPNSLNIEVNASVLSFVNPWNVPLGGTGRTVLTTFGVLIGEGSNNVNVTAAGTSGQVLIASTTGDPKFSTITSSGSTVTFTFGPNSLNIEVNVTSTFFNPLQVPNGGTGRTVLTTFGVLIGEGSNKVNVTAAGTSGQVLIASTTGDPKFSTITSSGSTITFTFGPNSLNIEVNVTSTFFNPLQVPNGGTGRTVLTTFGVLIGEGSNKVNVTAAGTSGQVLIASTTGDPKFSTITSSGSTITFTFGPNSLNIEVNVTSTFFNPLQVPNGGTGRTVLTTFGVLIGEGSNNVNVTAAGTSGQILIASTTGDPKFSTITSSGSTLALTVGPNSLNVDINAPVTVPFGGSGRSVLTTFGVLIGEGSNNVNVTAAGTSGQVLIASTTGDPKFSTITSSGSTVTFTFGPNSLNIEVNVTSTFFNPLQVPNGGTGRTVLTTFGVLIGEGSNNVNVTAAGTNGQVLIASTTGDPTFSTITSSGSTLALTVGPNSFNVDISAPLVVPFGGTGQTVLTTFGVLIGEGSNDVNVTAAGTSGQVLIASTTGDPTFSTITSSGGTVVFTAGPNSLNIDIISGSLTWNNVTSPSVSAAVNNGYLANNAGLVTVILPSTAALFSSIAVAGWGTGGWKIAQNSGQAIQLGTKPTTTGTVGFLASTNQFDSVNLLCTVANTNFLVLNSFGNINYN